jgi:urea transport system permease protein
MNAMLVKPLSRIILFILACWLPALAHAASPAVNARQTIVQAILAEEDDKKRELLATLVGHGDEAIVSLLNAWKSDALFIHAAPDGTKTPVELVGDKDEANAQAALRVDTGKPFTDAAGKPLKLVGADLTAVEHNTGLRKAMKAVVDVAELAAPDPDKRAKAIQAIGRAQVADKIPALEARLKVEQDGTVKLALREALALIRFYRGGTKSRRSIGPRAGDNSLQGDARGHQSAPLVRRLLRHAVSRCEPGQHPARRRARPRHHIWPDGGD